MTPVTTANTNMPRQNQANVAARCGVFTSTIGFTSARQYMGGGTMISSGAGVSGLATTGVTTAIAGDFASADLASADSASADVASADLACPIRAAGSGGGSSPIPSRRNEYRSTP